MSTLATQTATTTWNIDPAHSVAEFKVKHMMISNVKGTFSGLSGTLLENPSDPTRSSVEASPSTGRRWSGLGPALALWVTGTGGASTGAGVGAGDLER